MAKGFHDKKRCARVAAIFKTLAHPQRLLIICCLCQHELTVGELQQECGAPQSVISQQLTRLRLEGIVTARRTGTHVHYRIANARLPELIQNLEKMFHG